MRYSQSGMLMGATALPEKTPKPTDVDIDAAMTSISRFAAYQRVRAAMMQAAGIAPARPVSKKRA